MFCDTGKHLGPAPKMAEKPQTPPQGEANGS